MKENRSLDEKTKLESDPNLLVNLEKMIENENYRSAIQLLKNNGFKVTGEGQYKIVFSLGPKKVLKVAKNSSGLSDINTEVSAAECAPEWFPKIYSSGRGWAVVERAAVTYKKNKQVQHLVLDFFDINLEELNDISESEFYGFSDIINWIKGYKHYKRYGLESYRNILRYFLSKPNFKEFLLAVKNCNLRLDDLHLNNIALNSNGHFIIIDLYSGYDDYQIDFD